MSRVAELLTAIGGVLRAAKREDDSKVFTEVRVELGRYELDDLLKESTRAPTARVCFLRSKPVPRSDAGIDLDVSVAIIVVAKRQGRANPDFSSADLAALDLVDRCAAEILRDPYVGRGQMQAADLGDQLVAVSDEAGGQGIAIALMEVKWRLLDAQIARPVVQLAIATGRVPDPANQVTINDGPVEDPPLGYEPPVPSP